MAADLVQWYGTPSGAASIKPLRCAVYVHLTQIVSIRRGSILKRAIEQISRGICHGFTPARIDRLVARALACRYDCLMQRMNLASDEIAILSWQRCGTFYLWISCDDNIEQ